MDYQSLYRPSPDTCLKIFYFIQGCASVSVVIGTFLIFDEFSQLTNYLKNSNITEVASIFKNLQECIIESKICS